ncbi:hypothetical protein CEXT_661551 [Caerostris extrusa]|uniref:Uncharacterized protein n=1 Tax=Caerostris extrusa TaxID=172846 RepID=A0AAV4PQK4_CAEEX|nr:hypothetical protein CEXT_661551 [Caerostris extrusa]
MIRLQHVRLRPRAMQPGDNSPNAATLAICRSVDSLLARLLSLVLIMMCWGPGPHNSRLNDMLARRPIRGPPIPPPSAPPPFVSSPIQL